MTMTLKTGVTEYTLPNDRDIVVTRLVDAPRAIVFDCWTNPKHLPQWMLGPPGWEMTVCEIDLRPGGAWRYGWRKAEGEEMVLFGTVREVKPPERLVTTENWGGEWPEAVQTLEFSEENGRTTMTMTLTYVSKEVRDAALATGMKEGMDISFDHLDRLVAKLA